MLTILCSTTRIAPLLIVLTLLSCSKNDNNSPVVPPQSQSQNEMQAQVAPPPKPPVEDIKDYNGVPWGIEFEKFKGMKKYEGDLSNSNSVDRVVAVVLGTPIYRDDFIGLELLQEKLIPDKFYSAHVSADDVDYIFYDGKFAMAFSTVMAKNYDQYYETLSKKYSIVDTMLKKVTDTRRVKNPDEISATLFKGGNTRIYLIKKRENEGSFGTFIGVSVLYIPDKYYSLINGAITKNENMSPEKHQADNSLKKDMDKLK